MSTGLTLYQSTDASAPVLTGQTGSLITLLDAVLKDGYGSKAAAGSSGGAGAWTKPFSASSKGAYRPAAGNQFYMNIDDAGPGAGTFKEARITGYETMSAISTGTNPLPTVAQAANGLFIRKSNTADATARPWKIIADDRMILMFVQTGDSGSIWLPCMWGDFASNLSGDGYRTQLCARATENSASVALCSLINSTSTIGTQSGCYFQRNRSGTVGAVNHGKISPGFVYGNIGLSGSAGLAYPNGEDGGLYIEPFLITDSVTAPANSVRGTQRGVWFVCHSRTNFNDGDIFAGTGDLAGKSFLIMKGVEDNTGSAGANCVAIETSDTLLTSS